MTKVSDLVFHGSVIDWSFRYRARCSGCGWEAKRWRAIEETAEADHKAHVAEVHATSEAQA